MKTTARAVILMLAVVLAGLSACGRQDGDGDTEKPTTFATPEEAAARAKSDLLGALEGAQNLNIPIDPARLRTAQAAELITHAEVDFARVLDADTVATLMDIAAEKSRVAPFVDRGEVVAVAEVAPAGGSWRVSGLVNRPITRDLNRAGLVRPSGEVTAYAVPNLNLTVYGVRGGQGERYHVDFAGFSLIDGVDLGTLYPVLRDSAVSFERRFGDVLEKERLVK